MLQPTTLGTSRGEGAATEIISNIPSQLEAGGMLNQQGKQTGGFEIHMTSLGVPVAQGRGISREYLLKSPGHRNQCFMASLEDKYCNLASRQCLPQDMPFSMINN